jgi:predicted amidohydrolase YtcJ
MNEPLLLFNADIATMDEVNPSAQALLIENGIISRVGRNKDFASLLDSGIQACDLKNQAVLPGFIDSHQHMVLTGLLATAIDLSGATCIDDVLALCRDQARQTDKGEWVRGSCLNDVDLREKRMPTRFELDEAVPDHPVYLLHPTIHLCSFNSAGFEALNMPPGLLGVDVDFNTPTGVIRDPAIVSHVLGKMSKLLPNSLKYSAIESAAEMAIRKGITTLHALDGGAFGPGETSLILEKAPTLPLRIVGYNQSMKIAETKALGLPRIGGCICADGAFEAHTAALFEAYSDMPDNYGDLTFSQEEMNRFVKAANREELQISVHCESERAIEQVLNAIEYALNDFPRTDHRHRIEHLELPTWKQIERMKQLGVATGMQPAFIPAFIGGEDMCHYRKLLGNTRLDRIHPYRTLLDHGITIAGGSDSPVTPYSPLAGIKAAVNHPNKEQRITRTEALQMFTRSAAWIGFEEGEKGVIREGMLADLVVLEENPMTCDGDLEKIKIKAVYVDGNKRDISA